MPKKRTRKLLISPSVLSLIFLIVSWELIDFIFDFNKIILPSPHEILTSSYENISIIASELLITGIESTLGFILGAITAYLIAIIFTYSEFSKQALYPYAIAIKSTPIIAIAPLLVLWFGNGIFSKIVMAALVSFFPVLVNSVDGLKISSENLELLMESIAASPLQVLVKIRLPNSLPYLFSSLKVSSSLAVVGAVIGEFTGASKGIGHLIVTSSYYFDTPLMFSGIIAVSCFGIAFFSCISWLERRIIFW